MSPNPTPAIAFATCDLCDPFKSDLLADSVLRVLPPRLRSFGGRAACAGPAATVVAPLDNSFVKLAVESPGHGRVLVVAGSGDTARALLGGNLAAAAAKNGWAGVLVDGAVRDAAELAAADVAIFALATNPMPTDRKGAGSAGGSVTLQGVAVHEGDWIYADADGVIVARRPLHAGA